MDRAYIKAKLAGVKHEPGSYQMKDKYGDVIYVGKARDLHSRLSQYFTGSHDFKTARMVERVADFDFIVTASEKEALLLEITLIKKYRPRYNIQFRDDTSYPYIKITDEDYPRLLIARNKKKDPGARYFGPFPDVDGARKTARLLQTLYPFRRCERMPAKVCLYYHMGQCLAPCVRKTDPVTYKKMTEKAARFLSGDTGEVVKDLEKKMYEASEAMDYEKAAQYKEYMSAVKATVDRQVIEKADRGSRDVFAWHEDRGYISLTGLLVRQGVVLTKEFRLQPLYGEAADEFAAFVSQYYQSHPLPKELILPKEADAEAIGEIVQTRIVQPLRGYKRKLLDMAKRNALTQLDLKFETVEKQKEKTRAAVNDLSRICGREMLRVELFDNAHIAGHFPVSACVVYQDGLPSKKDYRLYRLHTGNDDAASMREAVYRRYFRLLKEDGRMPDGIIVDGGRIQINAAMEILTTLQLADRITVMGLVKDDRHNTDALMDKDGHIVHVDKDSELFFLLTRMQDEVHRFAITYHKKLRSKAATRSLLDDIEGVGPVRRGQLLKAFGSLKELRKADQKAISEVVPEKVAQSVYEALHAGDE